MTFFVNPITHQLYQDISGTRDLANSPLARQPFGKTNPELLLSLDLQTL